MCFGERICATCPHCNRRSWSLRWYHRPDGSFCMEGYAAGSCDHPWIVYSQTRNYCPECVQYWNNVPDPSDNSNVPDQPFHPDDTQGVVARALHYIQDPDRGNVNIALVPENQLRDQIAEAEAENAWRRAHREEVNALNAALGMVPRQSEIRIGDTTDWHDSTSAVRFRSRDNSITRFLRAPANTPVSDVPQTPIPGSGGLTPLHDAPVTPGPQPGSSTPMYQAPAPSPFLANVPLLTTEQNPDGAVTPVYYPPSPFLAQTALPTTTRPRTLLQTIPEDSDQAPYTPAYHGPSPPVVNTPLPSYNQAAAATPPPPVDLPNQDAAVDPASVLREYVDRIRQWTRPIEDRLAEFAEEDDTNSPETVRAAQWLMEYLNQLYVTARDRADQAPWEGFEQTRVWMLDVLDNPDNHLPNLIRRLTEWTRLISDEFTRDERGIQESARREYALTFGRQERRYLIRQGARTEDEIGELIRMEMHEEGDLRIENAIYGRAEVDISFDDNYGDQDDEDNELMYQMIMDSIPEEQRMDLDETPN